VRIRFAWLALLVLLAFTLMLSLQRAVAAGEPGAQQGTAADFAQAATPTPAPTEPLTTTGQLTGTETVTPVETQVAPVDTLRPAIGFSQTAMISPSQVLTGRAVEPGGSLPVSVSIQLVKVAEGLIDPINVVSARDGSGRLFVVERHGVIRIVNSDGQIVEEPFLDISNIVLSAFLEQGLYDIEFHPDFAQNGRFFVHFAELLRNGDSLIVEYAVSDDDPNLADPNSAKVILQIEQPWANHNGGELAFGPDGYLYIGSGDGGWEGDPLGAGQDLSTLLGKVLRIDVDVEDGRAYAIPPDNPFAQAATPRLVQLFGTTEQEFARIHTEARPEIWAYGLRNPWKFQFDRQTGDLYLPDVGQNFWEEINFQPANSPGGENYGWDFLMGTYCFPIEAEQCNAVGVLPVAQYSHLEDGCTIIGMGVYRGEDFADLDGIYFSGDYCSGRVWGLMRNADGTWAYAQLLDTGLQFTGAGEDENGTLFVTSCHCNYGGGPAQDNPPGEVWRIVPADQVPEGAETAPTQ
jgi:glucose/arabinose dehydrogenase